MKIFTNETNNLYIIYKEKPYKDLMTKDTLILISIIFIILILFKMYTLIFLIIFFSGLATLQTLEDNFMIIIDKKQKTFTINKYYMGKWKFKSYEYDKNDFSFIQVEKQVTSIREDGRFSINIVKEVEENNNKKQETLLLLKNLDLEDIEQAKVISFMLDIPYEKKIKYKAELI
ncbi:MAG: hypothetical protein KatS3mg068_0364 [Candidatus Sericytochromatia bacterium]|nr:MAG: hypothetical protein KatS3mg068_0364 [Candidatus Sericytochromatia bacterium]